MAEVCIRGDAFLFDKVPTCAGRTWEGRSIEGLLFNSRMVQATFDDRNPETRSGWSYPDEPWDPERNLEGFLAQLPEYRAHGLRAVTLNLQGGHPQGYGFSQPWINSGFDWDGRLRPEACARMERVFDRTDEVGMAVILGLFYFGQEPRMEGEPAILRATDEAVDWLDSLGVQNVLIEIANECDFMPYKHDIVRPPRVVELIRRVKDRSRGKLLVSASTRGGAVPTAELVEATDFILLHGNGVSRASGIAAMAEVVRSLDTYRGQPILYNEDDHFDYGPEGHFQTAVRAGAGWGYFDYRMKGEAWEEGFQSVPTDWRISSERKRGFFETLKKITGGDPS